MTEFKQTWNFSLIQELGAAGQSREFKSVPSVFPIKVRLTIPLNEETRVGGIIISYAGVVTHLSMRYGIEAIIGNADEKVRNLWQRSLVPSDASQKIWDVKVRCAAYMKNRHCASFSSKILTSGSAKSRLDGLRITEKKWSKTRPPG